MSLHSQEIEPIETVVIPTAGAGSRLISMTSYLEKCLIPVDYGEPVVNFPMVDAICGGAKNIIFVASRRGRQQLEDKYGKRLNPDLVAQLRQVGKHDDIVREEARRADNDVNIDYVIQPAKGEYGTTVPLYLAKSALKGIGRFGYMMGDDFAYSESGESEFGAAVRDLAENPADHLAMANPISREEAVKYGIFSTDINRRMTSLIEKPKPEQVPAHPLMNISKYILSANIWDHVDTTMEEDLPESAKGERLFTRTIALAQAEGQSFLIHGLSPGVVYLDGGTVDGLRRTSAYVHEHPQRT